MKAEYKKYRLVFKKPSGTSRGVLYTKDTYFLIIHQSGKKAIGECNLFKGLSIDNCHDYEKKLQWLCQNINKDKEILLNDLVRFPSIQFGLEQALLCLSCSSNFELFPSDFTRRNSGIPINGLIWMGNKEFMYKQIEEKLDLGFSTIKMKIGGIDFETECDILRYIRSKFSKDQITLRLDANGSFSLDQALYKLECLSAYDIHSIEQPICVRKWEKMYELCRKSPIPIALDEDLIGLVYKSEKESALREIHPQHIVLKPSLVGGFKACEQWINLAEKLGISWWITSALESNIGLNAISQWTYTLNKLFVHGLGTGDLFVNNFSSPLNIREGCLYYTNDNCWDLSFLNMRNE